MSSRDFVSVRPIEAGESTTQGWQIHHHVAGKSTTIDLANPPCRGWQSRHVGSLLENFVLGELARQLGWAQTRAALHHYRTRDGVEVDGVLEAADGRIVGIEIKAGETVRGDDFNHLRHLQARVPERFHHGLVLHTGAATLPFGDRLTAAPIDTLWRAADRSRGR